MLFRLTAVFIQALALTCISGCAVTSPVFSDADVNGPPLASGQITKLIRQCTYPVIQGFPASGSGTSCAYAFSDGVSTEIKYSDLFPRINQSLILAKPLHPFLNEFRKRYQPNETRHIRYQAYKLYLVALKPIVIVGVPITEKEMNWCSGSFETGCFYVGAKETMDAYIHYGRPPPVRPNSFWFLPESGLESAALPDDSPSVATQFGETSITLSNIGGYWQIVSPHKMPNPAVQGTLRDKAAQLP